MAENDQNEDQNDELGDISEDDAKRLLDPPEGEARDDDPDGAEHLGDPGRKALDSIKEQRRQARQERDDARKELAEMRTRLRGHEDKDKSELQRLQEALKAADERASKAESSVKRREIAEDRAPDHATPAQIRAVAKRLSGDTEDALSSDADELYALIAPAPAKTPPGKPKERLRGGGDPDEGPDEMDPRKLAAGVPRRR